MDERMRRAELERARRRFDRWRRTRNQGERIPERLWAAAVSAAEACGVEQTAEILRVDGERLRRHMESARETEDDAHGMASPAFVELAPAVLNSSECTIELEDADGGRGYDQDHLGRKTNIPSGSNLGASPSRVT